MTAAVDAVIVGSGPNGLAAAVELARRGHKVIVFEAESEIGGGTRTEELTLPGVLHDVCAAVHPLGAASPFFTTLPLADYGLEWLHPEIAFAHPLDDGTAAAIHRSVPETLRALGPDADAYRRTVLPTAERFPVLAPELLGPMIGIPRHPLALARFGRLGILPASVTARRFSSEAGKALWAGLAAHTMAPLDAVGTSAVAIVLAAAAHGAGWPFAKGGSQAIARALAGYLFDLGGEIVTSHRVTSTQDIPPARVTLFDLSPGAVTEIVGSDLSRRWRRAASRWQHGPGSFKVDWVLDGPVPWSAPACRSAGTVHVGGRFAEIADSEQAAWDGETSERPFVLVAQPSLVDSSRAPAGHHVVWGYCHTPAGSPEDHTDRVERQIERFAPGFRRRIVARHTMGPAELEAHNANYVGGDIGGGAFTIRQVAARPIVSSDPYRIGDGLFLCSSSTPPGAGVHGMSGYHAARSADSHLRAIRTV